MPARRRRVAVLLAAAVLAAPSAAWGQGAGDEQYQDPFEGGGGQGGDSAQPTPEPAAEPEAPPAATTAPVPTTESVQTSPAADQLPRTGDDAGLLALGGAVLLAGGVALRVRVR